MTVDPEIIAAWTLGWTRARETPPPDLDRGGWRVEVGWADQVRRWVFPVLGGGVVEVAEAIDAPFNLLKVPAPPEALHLPARWSIARTGAFMTCDAPIPASPAPEGYDLRLTGIAHGLAVELRTGDGDLAAHGRAVTAEGLVVFDRIRVEEPHRRRGLGRAVMAALDAGVREAGAQRCALTSTDMGRHLYEALGFHARAPWTTAQVPPPLPPA